MTDWPTKIEGNEFSIAKLDPETPLTFKVQTWSNLFEKGGVVCVDGYDAEGKRKETFAKIDIPFDGSVIHEREHLQSLVADFNKNLAANWRGLVTSARAYVAAHYAKSAADYAEKAANAAKGIF